MARLLLTVNYVSSIRGRGIVLFPGFVPVDDERFKVGDPVLLRYSGGPDINTNISGLELPYPNPKHEVLILLTELSEGDVPVGTEVWSA